MKTREEELDHFFNHYCSVFNKAIKSEKPDARTTAELFASCFIGADPNGVNCGQNNETFMEAMQNGYSFYKSIGITSMDIVSKKITPLDPFHTMVNVRWKSVFVSKEAIEKSIEFENIYFVQTRNEQHKVFAYITADEQAALKEAGLI